MRRLTVLVAALFALMGAGHAESPFVPLIIIDPLPQVVRGDEAQRLVADINHVRAQHGLAPVGVDLTLSKAALSYARDMAARRFFGHFTPDGTTLPDRLAALGYQWTVAAENIALDEDERHANEALLESPPHRANILDPRVTHIGVAALAVGIRAALYVEEFTR